MIEPTVELVFGLNAGTVWEALNKNGASTIDNIVKATGLRRELVYGALGWLGREDKILVERRGRAMVFSLRETEARLDASEGIKIGDSVPQKKSKPRRSVPSKKTTKARSVKAPAKQAENPASQSARLGEFLLH